MAACTDTSSALVGSSHTTMRGSPAKARAIATRCFSPPDSWRGFRSRCRGVSRRWAARASTRLLAASPLMPVSFSTLRIRMRRTDQLRLSAESGFWNTICMARLSSVLRPAVLGATVLPSSATVPPLSADSMPRIVLARVDLPEPDSPTMPSVSPSASCRSTSTSAGTSLLRCLNVFERLVSSSTSGLASDGARIPIGASGSASIISGMRSG